MSFRKNLWYEGRIF